MSFVPSAGQLARPAVIARLRRSLRDLAPGLALAGAIAVAAMLLRRIPHLATLSPLILAILIGMAVKNTLGLPAACRPGVAFSLRRLLRLAIVLLGLQLTAAQLVAVGGTGLAITAATLLASFTATLWLGRWLGVERRLAELIAGGTAVCGASAVIAVNSVTRGSDEDVAYAVACVTVFGSLAMILYPAASALLGLGPRGAGLWAGASIHEVAQVVAAAFQSGHLAGEFATVVKLSRVMLLAPLVLTLGALAARRRAGKAEAAPPLPWFVLGFIAMIAVNSLDIMPGAIKAVLVEATPFLLAVALAAMGLETDFWKLCAKGWKPALLGAAAWLFIGLFSLALIELAGVAQS